jgi:hypothetical protein
MMSLIDTGPAVFAPMLAGALLPILGVTGILTLDVITFALAIFSLLMVYIPQPEKTMEGQEGKGSLLKEASFGFQYIFQRKSLLGLLTVILLLNFVQGISGSLFAPMLLSRTNNNSAVLGWGQSAFAIGGVVGGLIVSAWGGLKKNRIRGMLIGWSLFAFFGMIVLGVGRSLTIWIPTSILAAMTFPFTQSASNAIWQSKVAPDIQGRVFSARRLIAWLLNPIMPLIAGAIADHLTEPAMTSQTWLAETFGWLVGTGAGSGMALQHVISGAAYIGIIVVAWFIPAIRNVEEALPDHDQLDKLEDAPTQHGGLGDEQMQPAGSEI